MWLLSTSRAELHRFADHTVVQGGYAILSHTWGSTELTFQDLQNIVEKCKRDGKNPRDCVSEKIRGSCILAEKNDYEWIWIDSCCIDKMSSSELSEAVNSMFEWYLRSKVCYAPPEDVSSNCDLHAPESDFRKARWHTRGWTLQQLIAPSTVVFISKDWGFLGTKLELADLLSNITGVFDKTTRVEDEAYCLMGLFGINMPIVYGEGRQAFQRLQEEILKRTSDMSLFAWGWPQALESADKPSTHEGMSTLAGLYRMDVSLFADSPEAFREAQRVIYAPSAQWKEKHDVPEESTSSIRGPFGELELPRITRTNSEIQFRLPVFDIDGITVVILLCDFLRAPDDLIHIGLLLHPVPNGVRGAQRPLYRPGCALETTWLVQRLVALGNDYYNMTFRGKKVTAEWRDIPIEQNDLTKNSRDRVLATHCSLRYLGQDFHSPFHIPTWLVTQFQALRFTLFPQPDLVEEQGTGSRRLFLVCSNGASKEAIIFILGVCSCLPSVDNAEGPPSVSRWARVHIRSPGSLVPIDDAPHNCSQDHITDWKDWSKAFGDADRTMRLFFTRWTTIPGADTLVMHVELDGHVYKKTSQSLNVPLPSLSRSRAAEVLLHPGSAYATSPPEYEISFPSDSPTPLHMLQNRSTSGLPDSSEQVFTVREFDALELSVKAPTQFRTLPREPHSPISLESVISSVQYSKLPPKTSLVSYVWNVLVAVAVSFSG